MMNGSASQGLILHEGGHIFTYGMLANNEWRSGWMDEGLTEYQTEWALGQTRPERAAGVVPLDSLVRGDSALASPGGGPTAMSMPPSGYASLAARPPAAEQTALGQYRLDLLGRAEPIGTPGPEFNEFAIYNSMIYDRGAMMYGALRDAIGDDAFARFLRGYYARWAFRHVDEAAMRAEAERASGRDLGWFFDEWVHRTGLVDYALRSAKSERVADGWVTRVRVARKGEYAHPVPVGVRTSAGWTIVRGDPLAKVQTVEVRTAAKPVDVQLDPLRTTEDWYRPNDFHFRFLHGVPRGARPKYVVDWPFLAQSQADRYLYAVAPMLTSSQPNGLLYGLRVRGNYQGLVDRQETGILFGSRSIGAYGFPLGPRDAYGDPTARLVTRSGKLQWWTTGSNPRLGPHGRPVIGLAYGLWNLDGITKVQLQRTWDTNPFLYAAGPRDSVTLAFTGTYPYSRGIVDPARWSGRSVSEARAAYGRRSGRRATGPDVVFGVDASLAVGYMGGTPAAPGDAEHGYARGELALSRTRRWAGGRDVQFLRGYAAYAEHAPVERQVYASADDPTSTFANHLWRPMGGPLAPSVPDYRVLGRTAEYRTLADGHYLPLGGAALRGYDPLLTMGSVVAVNAEQAHRL
ncbi:MAG TPA: M1 family aminopeptidase, partial [Gemmatimonadaceae bacterium]|nr:M1 family aminopeptidase [Gemmatimonadaceae bacterium]